MQLIDETTAYFIVSNKISYKELFVTSRTKLERKISEIDVKLDLLDTYVLCFRSRQEQSNSKYLTIMFWFWNFL